MVPRTMLYLILCSFPASHIHIKCDQIQSADTYDGINDPCEPGHITKDKRHQVKRKKSNHENVEKTKHLVERRISIAIF